MILQAVSATRWYFGEPPASGMVTMIDTKKVKPMKRRGVDHWGYCYEKAGFSHVGETQGGLLIFQLLPEQMPDAIAPLHSQLRLSEARPEMRR